MEYTKRPIDYPQQIQMLKERGLIINGEKRALEQLRIISYFRLANYLRPMEQDRLPTYLSLTALLRMLWIYIISTKS